MAPRVVLGLVLAVTLVALAPGRAYACLCGGTSEDSPLDDSTASFIGVVARVDDPMAPFVIFGGTADPLLYTFAVEEVRKGDLGEFVVIRSARSGVSCGLEMAVGERWSIHADRWEGELWVGLCGPSERLAAGLATPFAPNPVGPDLWGVAVVGLGLGAVLWMRRRRRARVAAP